MTDTDRLIETLTRDLRPISRYAVGWRLCSGIILGSVVSLGIVASILGFRPDLAVATHSFSFWMKWAYTISLSICAVAATRNLARPDTGGLGGLWIIALPVAVLAIVGGVEMAGTPRADWFAMWLGMSWKSCSSSVFLLSIPIFVGLLWSFRNLAPTRLRAAGAAAGLTAGAWAATLYCLHCPEVSAIFVLSWYSLGIALAAIFGALVGPHLLRW